MTLRLFHGRQLRQLLTFTKSVALNRTPQYFIISSRCAHGTQRARHEWKDTAWRWGITSLCGAAGVIAGGFVQHYMSSSRAHASKRMVKNEANFIADVVEEALPSVVAIEVG